MNLLQNPCWFFTSMSYPPMWPLTQSFRIVSTNLPGADRCQAAWNIVPEIFFGNQFKTDLIHDYLPSPLLWRSHNANSVPAFSSQRSCRALGWPLPAPGSLLAFTWCISLCLILSAYFKAAAPTPAPTRSPTVSTNSFMSHYSRFISRCSFYALIFYWLFPLTIHLKNKLFFILL